MKNKGFTLIELLIVIAIIAITATIVFVALNPLARFEDARNSRRYTAVASIADSIRMYQIDNKGAMPLGIDNNLRMLGTADLGCSISCGSTSEISYHSTVERLNYYTNNTYTVRNWFDASEIVNFDSITVSAVLDCDGNCNGTTRIRIGNATSYNDYDFVDSSSIRTNGTTSNYSWYTNTFSVSKATLGDYFFVQLLLYPGTGTVKFMMDESGPAGPDPEFRSGSNGTGSQAGWNNDNGDYFIKIGLPEMTAIACLDLSPSLSKYLNTIPVDPKEGVNEKTNYAIKTISSENITGIEVVACTPEGNEVIQTNR